MDPATVPIAEAVLRSYALGDPALERELLQAFLRATRDDMAGVRAALAAGDAEAIARAAHRIKGSSRMIGAYAQGDAAEQLERSVAVPAAAAAALEATHARLVAWLEEKTGGPS